jgi:DNA-binding beta-propeller fold protein YncE
VAAMTGAVAANPFGVAASTDATYVATGSGVEVLDRSNRIVARVPVPGAQLLGAALDPNRRLLFVAADPGVAIIDTNTDRLVAHMTAPNERGTIEVAVSPDSRYVAATEEDDGLVTIFDVSHRSMVAQVPVAPAPVGATFTPDGRALLVTSESATRASGSTPEFGVVQVIDTLAWHVHASVPAGCEPVRVAVSPTGQTWVTARGSDAVEEFDTARLEAGAPGALLEWLGVGPAPVGVTVANDGKQIIVADSNRFVAPRAASTLTIINAAGPGGLPTTAGTVVTQGFPRDLTTAPDGHTVIASCYSGGTIDIVSLPH